jgi:hypothetical protein
LGLFSKGFPDAGCFTAFYPRAVRKRPVLLPRPEASFFFAGRCELAGALSEKNR